MEMKYFSHEHPLILRDEAKADKMEVICYGCQRPISEVDSAYECGKCKDYFLHKVCAELPREIMHPKHDKHSLILLPRSHFSGNYICDVCGLYILNGFLYQCSLCNFGMDIACVLKDSDALCVLKDNDALCLFKDRIIMHDSHEHSLIFQPRPALFCCDACGEEDKDHSYLCPSCPFLIHKSCASLQSTAKYEGHDHTLFLAYGFPSDYQNFDFCCDICRGWIFPKYWIYYCGLCRYFVHLKCMTRKTPQIETNIDDDLLDDANFEKKLLKVLLDDDLLHLPATDISENLIKRFLLRKNSLAQIRPKIRHWSHSQHPLILFNHEKQNDKNIEEEDEEILCNGCIEPISTHPYYSCSECNYFLHLPCAYLPRRLQHPIHPHPLSLRRLNKFHACFYCNICQRRSNGFFFKCQACNFFLDIKCAAMPTVIEHESHNHPLFQFKGSHEKCNVCGCSSDCDCNPNHLVFGCVSCDFYMHHGCAMLPRAIRHKWDKHPLPLRFPPYSDHPDDFYCDMCELEMHPKLWLYHCSECDNSFHTKCVPRLDRFRNVKFGGIVEVSSHPHSLEFKRKATLKSSCDGCGANIEWYPAFECEDCNFCLCRSCVLKMS